MLLAEQRRLLCEHGRRIVETGLVLGTSGNLSVRLGDLVAVTPGGLALDRLEPEACPVVGVGGDLVEGDLSPSSETPMHLAIYAATGTTAVVHTHSTFATVVSAVMTELPPVHYNTTLLGGVVKVADYATYGTAELAGNVMTALGDRQAVLLANHGGVTLGDDLPQAFEAARLLEWLCEVYVRARALGEPRTLTGDQLSAVVRRRRAPAFPLGED
ncbi:class II aldolase/adducin family protein [Streptosporangium sp. NPDC000239]|uniref:Class II aldolase/adducin family protein n=1 Tax=Streptosporangium jomthongense TaxID=1193683 RepID=A0ABV8EQX5_9ACTN